MLLGIAGETGLDADAARQMLEGISVELEQTLVTLDRDMEWLRSSRQALADWPSVPGQGSEAVDGLLFIRTAEPELQRIRAALGSDLLASVDPSLVASRLSHILADHKS